jgi:inner membrane protein
VITAHPRPVSPFNWTVFVSDETTHRYAHVNLARSDPQQYQPGDGFVAKLDAAYAPLAQARWEERTRYGQPPGDRFSREAWNAPPLEFFRWFADLPALEAVTANPDCAWFVDLRFVNPGREYVPFLFGACRDAPSAPWRAYEREAGARIPLR